MPVSKIAFEGWLYQIGDGTIPSLSALSRASGLSKATFSLQRTKNAVQPNTIMRIARGYGLHPLQELARFDGFQGIWPAPEPPKDLLLTVISTVELVKEVLRRGGDIADPQVQDLHPPTDALIRWADRVGPEIDRKTAADSIGMRPENLSRDLNSRRLSFPNILKYADIAGTHPALGLCAAGWLEPSELPGVTSLSESMRACSGRQIWNELEASKRYVRATLESIITEDDMHRKLG